MKATYYPSISSAIEHCLKYLHDHGRIFDTENWQSVKAPHKMLEVLNVDFSCPMEKSEELARIQCKPSEPWADLHFAERVGGNPTNPGDTYHIWPYWVGEHLDQNSKFTHTYQERIWTWDLTGIRYQYGCLKDVVDLLKSDPSTRQAFLPIWFPEDTGAKNGRVPCTIGYHFIVRDGKLHTRYYIRSCDGRRHFHDDIYLCNRLALWVLNQFDEFGEYEIGDLTMNMTSFHVFEPDVYWLTKKFRDVRNQY
jgi:thymidylate synthase